MRTWREAELAHCRVGMLAATGFLVQEKFHPLFSGDGGPAIQQIPNLPPFMWFAMTLGIGVVEGYRVNVGWASPNEPNHVFQKLRADYVPGDLGFDPLGLKPEDPAEFAEMQTKELQNGRLAMLAAAGFLAQELVNHKPILETLKLLILLDDSEISKNLGINLPTGDIPTLELELETSAKDTFF